MRENVLGLSGGLIYGVLGIFGEATVSAIREIYLETAWAGKGHPTPPYTYMQSPHIFCSFRGVTFLQPSQHVGETDCPTKNPHWDQ